MAIGASTFAGIGGAVSDIFAGLGAADQAKLKARGMRISAEGTRIGAEGTRLSAESLRIKARGDIAESENYDLAAQLARENKQFANTSTAIKLAQQDRELFKAMGQTRADVAGAGFAESGSALDILRESAGQGALARAVAGQQGLITEEGYEEQAKSYETMARAGRAAAQGEMDIAGRTDVIAQRQMGLASQEDILAGETEKAGQRAQIGAFIGAGFKILGAAATLIP